MATAKIKTDDGPCCPICLEQFNMPRQLPCAHTFCEKCLQSHITTEAAKHKKLSYFKCPVCRNSASPAIKDRPTSEWTTLFPVNTVLKSMLPAKSKVDRLCDACYTEGTTAQAEGFCVVCKESMCGDCLKVHRKQKISKDHTILSVEELNCNPENVMKLAEEGFTCSEHHGEDIRYYCTNHSVPCCCTCFFDTHKSCSKVIDLKKDLAALLCDSSSEQIIADMKKIELHLKRFLEINEACVNSLEPQVERLTNQIREVRQKINSALDELETLVKIEGNQIYKEEVLRKQDENHQCLSLMHSVRNSHYLLETVNKYGSNLQKFLMAKTMRSQLHFYCTLVGKKYEKTNTLTVTVQFSPMIQSILSISVSDLGKVVTTTRSNTLPLTCSQRPTKDHQIEKVDVIDLKVHSGMTSLFSGVMFLPGDRVMLAEYYNKQCILLSSSYQFITSHTLTGSPSNICVLDDQEVAVSLYNRNKIQILTVLGDIIRPVRMITTKYNCNGIAAAGKGEMVVNGYYGKHKSQWSLINTRGDVKCTHQYDSPDYYWLNFNYIAVNNMKTRVYVSVCNMNSLLCFDMDGKTLFTYHPDNLRGPMGIAVDRYDNIYILGKDSNNLHQLSSDGSVQQVVNTGVPIGPRAICIHQSKDILIITNTSEKKKLHIYQLK
ncbi:hypothetical protein ACJMK2_003590 [Sinanodonta woodiana]|uniref:Uncharacterized protein n=1 Tax=Sinanodonta woodiana TaxID=1069815 RepID=A0ABD3Y1Z9_SINWO